MPKKLSTTTPDPELSPPLASGNEVKANAPRAPDPAQTRKPQQPEGGGPPGTGQTDAQGTNRRKKS
jgi:hypothetical protein